MTPEQEKIKDRPIDRFFALYLNGRKKEKAPESYIDYFKASKFLLDEIDQARLNALGEAVKEIDEHYKKEHGINNWLDLREKIKTLTA